MRLENPTVQVEIFLSLPEFSVPLFGMCVPYYGMYVPNLRMCVPYYGTEISYRQRYDYGRKIKCRNENRIEMVSEYDPTRCIYS